MGKICTKCNIEKDLNNFHKRKSSPDGLAIYCKPCNMEFVRRKTKEEGRRDAKNYAMRHPERKKESFKKWYYENREKHLAELAVKRKTEEFRLRNNKYLESKKDIINQRRKQYRKNPTPNGRVSKILRDRFHKVIVKMKKGVKCCSWRELVGCSVDDLNTHIKSQFKEGMSWENHGNGEGKWNIDHIIPLIKFDLTKLEEQRKAFHYTNMRPIWFVDNMRRSRKKYNSEIEESF